MAAIDRCYVKSYEQYKAFKDWAKGREFKTPRGEKVVISRWIYDLCEEDFDNNNECPLFNTPKVIDNYLYHNCPLDFIQEWIKSRYFVSGYRKGNPSDVTADMMTPIYEPCSKVKVLHKGPANHPFKATNPFNCTVRYRRINVEWENDYGETEYLDWSDGANAFVTNDEFEIWSCSELSEQLTIKAIIRKILKVWKLPKRCTVYIDGYYEDDGWTLVTK